MASICHTLTSCEGQLDLTPIDASEIPSGYPEYNFSTRLVKKMADGNYATVDTMSIGDPAFIEIYLKQQDFQKNVKYKVTFELSGQNDATVLFEGNEYRQKDWIILNDTLFKDSKMYLKYQPLTASAYTVTFNCEDEGKIKKSSSKSIIIRK